MDDAPVAASINRISRLPPSITSTTTRRSSGDNAIFENLAGSPMVASRLPLRSNHTNIATGIGVLGT
jgi:hypothetical protein